MNRRIMREHIFKLVFAIEFNEEERFTDRVGVYLNELETSDTAREYIKHKAISIFEKLESIDEMINKNAEKWSISRMSKVDVSILRVAIYEIEFDEDIPTNVAINEAIEIAKKYGGDHSPSFVNGILAKVVN
ncbi:transcription antitermination factor NusB [Vallitalea sp.]|jgi:N utilization substance protein B|uniref:transcription antitermination factor NusB n=1 Tax=Vallitalea sp. TaxID=1882829 RepID=UPI0025E48A3D|nr:transcription antitermination factor NusB [Vallitalea sp.]MCT4687068.1 transcription antitermination factor NusB [Vallitalea sp.]